MAYKHGIYITETPTVAMPPVLSNTGIPVFIGTAPVNLAFQENNINVPIIAYSYEEAVEKLGFSENFKSFTLSGAIYSMFKAFKVAPAIFINVLDPENPIHTESVEEKEYIPQEHSVLIDDEGVLLSKITVKNEAAPLTLNTDYTAAFTADGKCIISLISDSEHYSASALNISYSKLKPEGVTAQDIIGEIDSENGEETGLHLIRRCYAMFGITPSVICCPKYSADKNVAGKMQSLCDGLPGDFKAECIIDIDTTSSGAENYTFAEDVKYDRGITSPHAIACYPMLKTQDGQYIHYSSMLAALIAYYDTENGDAPVNPSNKSLPVSATVTDDGTELYIDVEQANELNSAGIVTAVNFNGFRTWGNNTAAYPESTDPKDRWIYVRRYFTWRGNSFKRNYFEKVDDPTNYRLIEAIVDSENIVGNSHVAAGYAAMDKIEFRSSDNPITSILKGAIKFKMYLAPYTPAETIEAELEFDPYAIGTAISGGEE